MKIARFSDEGDKQKSKEETSGPSTSAEKPVKKSKKRKNGNIDNII